MSDKNDDLAVKLFNLFYAYQQLADLIPVDESGGRLLLMLNAEFEKLSIEISTALDNQPHLLASPPVFLKTVTV